MKPLNLNLQQKGPLPLKRMNGVLSFKFFINTVFDQKSLFSIGAWRERGGGLGTSDRQTNTSTSQLFKLGENL